MNHFTRLRQQDLGPLVSRMAHAALRAMLNEWIKSGRPRLDCHDALLLSSATLGTFARLQGDFPIQAWSEANRIAQDPHSLLNQSRHPGASTTNG